MQRTRVVRYLRIAVSAVCIVACVLLIGLWVRSYWRMDQLIRRVSTTDYVAYTTIQGQFVFGRSNDPILRAMFKQNWTRRGFAMKDWGAALSGPVAYFPATAPGPHDSELMRLPRFSSRPFVITTPGTSYYEVIVPYWLIVLSTASLAALPRIPWRFSLRTLMIATTLVAFLLGLVVYMAG